MENLQFNFAQIFITWKFLLFLYFVLLYFLYKYKCVWQVAVFDIILSLCGLGILVGVQLDTNVPLKKYILVSLVLFYLIRLLVSPLQKTYRILIVSVVQFMYLVLPIVNLAYYIDTGNGIGKDAMFAIVQTNFYEIISFLSSHFGHGLVLFLGILSIFFIVYKVNKIIDTSLRFGIHKKNLAIIGILFLVVTYYMCGHVIAQSMLYKSYIESKIYIAKITNKQEPVDLKAVNKTHQLKNVIVVIGESANRDYFSLYGFESPTTPWLEGMKKDYRMIWLKNSYSCDKFTGKALPMALSEQNQYNNMDFANSADLIEVFHKAGYKVWWISNQGRDNNISEIFTNIALRADYRKFISNDGPVLDEKLLEYLPSSLTKGNVIFIHQMGSHGKYVDRSPEEFKKIDLKCVKKNPNDLNEYCNSILYTDNILEKIFNQGINNLDIDVFLYFSDHGEKPGVPRDRFDYAMTRIPVVMWFSDEYIANNRKKFTNLKNHDEFYFTNDMIYDTILGIMDIDCNHYSNKFDLSSDEYDFNRSNVLTLCGEKKLDEDPYDMK